MSTITWTDKVISEQLHEISIVMPTQSTIKGTLTVSSLFFFIYYSSIEGILVATGKEESAGAFEKTYVVKKVCEV